MKQWAQMHFSVGLLLLSASAAITSKELQEAINHLDSCEIPNDESCVVEESKMIEGCLFQKISAPSMDSLKKSSPAESFCLMRVFLSSDFSIYLNPEDTFQELKIDICEKDSSEQNVRVLPADLPQGEWRKMTMRYGSENEIYYVKVDDEEVVRSERGEGKVDDGEVVRSERGGGKGILFLLRVQGRLKWSYGCDPRGRLSGATILLPWMLFLLMTLVVVGMVVFVFLQKRKQRQSLNEITFVEDQKPQQRPPIPIPEEPRPIQITNWSQHSGYPGTRSSSGSNPEDHIYEEIPEGAPSQVPDVPSSRGSAVSIANSLYGQL